MKRYSYITTAIWSLALVAVKVGKISAVGNIVLLILVIPVIFFEVTNS
jgi:hypothetical protein